MEFRTGIHTVWEFQVPVRPCLLEFSKFLYLKEKQGIAIATVKMGEVSLEYSKSRIRYAILRLALKEAEIEEF